MSVVHKKAPFIPQMEAVECGAACLTMVLAAHGHWAQLSEVREACAVSRDGVNAMNIARAARGYGLKARARRLEPADLGEVPTPAILHWEFNHFVVLERYTPGDVYLLDPGMGPRAVSQQDFDCSFTGICLDFEPTPELKPKKPEYAALRHYVGMLSGTWWAVAMLATASLALNALALALPLGTKVVTDHVLGRGRADWLSTTALCLGAALAAEALLSALRGATQLSLRQRLDSAIAVRFVAHLVRLPLAFLLQRHSADLMARVQTGRVLRDLLTGQTVSTLVDGLLVAGSLGLMCYYDAPVGGLVLLLGASSVALTLWARKPQSRRLQERQIREVREQVHLLQTLQGIVTLKSLGSERTNYERWRNLHVNALNASSREAALGDLITALLSALRTAAPLVVLAVGGSAVLAGQMSLGTLLALQMLQASFLGSLSSLLFTALRLEILPVLAQRLDDVLLTADEPSGAEPCPGLRGEIEFEGVTVRYGPTAPTALRDVSFRVAPGQKVALVGPSGCGKSTVARLLLGLFRPTEGRILLDGHDLSTLELSSVRNQIGVVLQETSIFDGTVRDNISLNAPNSPLEEVVNAARAAQIHDDILALPKGYDTLLSGSSPVLSGGQLQRLALARAILHRPAVLVLDEATSALDAVTEAAIEHHLSVRTCTRLVIAHRLSTVRDADLILVLRGGVVEERGKHKGLLEQGGLYAELIHSGERAETEDEGGPPPSVSEARVGHAVVERLGQFPVFGRLSEADRTRVAAALRVLSFRPGERLLEQDQAPTGVLLVHSGRVAVRIDEPGLPPWTVAELAAPQVFGEIGLLDGSPSSAQVVALEPCHAELLPISFVEELRSRGDTLASRLALAFGALVARRLVETQAREVELLASGLDVAQGSASVRGRSVRSLALAETPLGALLSKDELAEIVAAGETRATSRGQPLLDDSPEVAVAVVLAGAVTASRGEGSEQVYGAGATVAATLLFGVPPGEQLQAGTDVSYFVARREDIEGLVKSGNTAAAKLVAHCARSVARSFRLANARLRELVAIRDNEIDQARRERAEALRMAQEEQDSLVASAWRPSWRPSRLPEVRAASTLLSAPTCLSAVLTALKRPVSAQVVAEACGASPEGELTPAAVVAGARTFHLDLRRIDVPAAELAAAEVPLLVRKKDDGGYVLLRTLRDGGAWVMDPGSGTTRMTARDLAAFYPGTAYEIHEDRDAMLGAETSFGERVASFARSRWRDLGNLGATALLLQSAAVVSSVLVGLVMGEALPSKNDAWLRVGLAVVAAAWLSQNLALWARSRLLSRLRALFDRDTVEQMLVHVLKLPIPFFEAHPPGDLLQRFQSFAQMRDVLSNQALAVVIDGVTLALSLGPLLALSPSIFAFVFASAAAHALVAAAAWPQLRQASLDEIHHSIVQQGRLMECLQGLVPLRLTGDHTLGVRRWAIPFLAELSANVRQERVVLTAVSCLRFARQAALVAALTVGARHVLEGRMALGSLLAAIGISSTFLEALGGLTLQLVGLSRTTVHWRNLATTFRERPEQSGESLAPPGQIQGHITLENVSFRYGDGGPVILDQISLDIPRGSKVALVGRSGSGKSTLGKLLMGFYLPASGRVLYDGRDIAYVELPRLRQQLGVVLQNTFLFGASIRENLSRGSDSIRFEDIQAAAYFAAIDDDIKALPMQYDTLLTEGGRTFSGGQRQRLAIARAVASRPAVLLLDEATSALDNKSQAAVEKRLSSLGCTRVVIAHRLSTVLDADLVVVLDKGRVVEAGRHRDLLKRQGLYHELVKAQLT